MRAKSSKAKRTVRAKNLHAKGAMVIQDCTFTGSPTAETSQAVAGIAAGLVETAKALGLLAQAIQPAPAMVINSDGLSK